MPNIRVLDPHVADLIAAGEVVERPASVVKELMENAFDAGAKTVTVEISNGGMSMIRVTDDGCGIAAGQARTAFLRHATSKISSEYDLEAIGTLGFRGEALAAISAVSRIELLTRTAEESLGTALSLEGGAVTEQEEAGCPVGTTMVVRDLFFNTPARLKFMKRDQAEGAAVFTVVQREALAHPEVGVKFFRDGKQDLLTPGDGALKSVIYAVFGRDLALGFTPVKGSGEGLSVEGFASLPVCCRGSRNYQHFFVNGRYVKSLTMQAAVEEAYKNQKMVGKFPGCVLHLTTKLSAVDVNVHPTKTEVKFSDERQVFSAVYHGVLAALEGDRSRPAVTVSAPAERSPRPPEPAAPPPVQISLPSGPFKVPFRPIGSGERLVLHDPVPASLRRGQPIEIPLPPSPQKRASAFPAEQSKGKFIPAGSGISISPPGADFDRAWGAPEQEAEKNPARTARVSEPVPVRKTPETPPAPEEAPPPVPEETVPIPEEPWTVRGELFRTYVLVEQGEKVLLIDKHAAHERMNFDRLKAADWNPMAQQLLTPLILSPTPEEKAVLLAHLELLEQFAFQVEDFGASALAVRQIPADIGPDQACGALTELAQKLLTAGIADPAGARDELLHTIACKAAIKGGWKSAREELEAVAEAVMSGRVKYCPHGRPVAIELTKKQLEKQFKRS